MKAVAGAISNLRPIRADPIRPDSTWQIGCSGLATDTIYFYEVGDPNYGMSQEFAFMTGPPVGPTSQIEVLINTDPVSPLHSTSMVPGPEASGQAAAHVQQSALSLVC